MIPAPIKPLAFSPDKLPVSPEGSTKKCFHKLPSILNIRPPFRSNERAAASVRFARPRKSSIPPSPSFSSLLPHLPDYFPGTYLFPRVFFLWGPLTGPHRPFLSFKNPPPQSLPATLFLFFYVPAFTYLQKIPLFFFCRFNLPFPTCSPFHWQSHSRVPYPLRPSPLAPEEHDSPLPKHNLLSTSPPLT